MKVNIEHLVMLVAILFILFFILNIKENFQSEDNNNQNENVKPRDKTCGQESVNYGFLHYIFNTLQSPRG